MRNCSAGETRVARPLVFQSDFGHADGAVSAMYGVAYSVCGSLRISDLTHEIQPFDIWEASYRLIQTVGYWPAGTVFVSVIDPGVGSHRRCIAAETTDGQYIITPDNGTLTHMKAQGRIKRVRIIDGDKNRLPGSSESYTFHGRDIFAFTGARLAAGIVSFEEIGPETDPSTVVTLPVVEPVFDGESITGTVDVLDIRFGSLWTNIPRELFNRLGIRPGERVDVHIENRGRTVYRTGLVYAHSFADAYVGEALVYINSLDSVAVAINQGSFARAYNIGTGIAWTITLKRPSASGRD